LLFWTPPASGALGTRRLAKEVWGKSVLTVADASEFSHGQDPEEKSILAHPQFRWRLRNSRNLQVASVAAPSLYSSQ
jgi:hypothetical protein